MPTCDVCNKSHEMLRDTERWDNIHREVVLKFLRLHLKQQQLEREHLELMRAEAREGKQIFIYSDAMTESKGSTPKEGILNQSKPGKYAKCFLFSICDAYLTLIIAYCV